MSSSRSGGFSLVEALCALAIFGFAVVGLLHGITTALRASKEAERHATAVWLASERLSLLRAEGWIVEGEDEGEFEEPFGAFAWRQTIDSTAYDGLYEVALSIEHAEDRAPIYDLHTLIFERPYDSSGSGTTGSGTPGRRDRLREREARLRGGRGGTP